jgi:hypothetical protein
MADDATFLRRVFLDLAGTLPSPERTAAFLADKDPGKRAKLVDELLAGDSYPEHWARFWFETFTGGYRPFVAPNFNGRVLFDYLVEALADNKSYQQIVRELITGEGLSEDSGPANFIRRYNADTNELTGATARLFLGVSLQCAQCHNHPFEKWKQDDFEGMAAFFVRLRNYTVTNEQNLAGIVELRRGELEVPDTKATPNAEGQYPNRVVPPRLLGGSKLPLSTKSRRHQLADWVTSSNNYFSRNAVNRIWQRLFGEALVEPLDTLGRNPGRNPELLGALAEGFAGNGFELEKLLRGIVLSRTYQRSSGPIPENLAGVAADQLSAVRRKEASLGARFPIRPLTVDQLYQAVYTVTGYQDEAPRTPEQALTADPPVEHLSEIANTLPRSLALLNSAHIEKAVEKGVPKVRGSAGRRIGPAHIERLYLATLCRRPEPAEAARMLQLLDAHEDKNKGLEDVLWALFNSAEFNSNH